MTEDQWVKKAKSLNARPPMPWFNVRAMTTNDLRALYRYARHLGPAGKPAPAYVPPGKAEPGTPIEIDVRGKPRQAEVREKPLYSKER